MNKLKNFKWSLGFLIIGTIISIAIGQMLANSFNSPYQYIIGLLSEIVVIVISLGLFFYEINTRIVDLIRDHDLFVSAGEFIIKSDDASFKNAYNNIKEQLKELVKGHCVLDDLQAVYNDDIESIMALKPGEKLYSMCPVGSIFEEVSMQFTNKSFNLLWKSITRQ